jgi:uncharacterized protein
VISLAEASFMLLGLAIATVWWPHACRFGAQVVPVWSLIFITACAAALTAGTIDFAALGGLGLLALACRASKHPMPGVALSATWLAGSLALLLALHAWPGFQALPIIEGWQASPDARPFTLRASFDKAAAGLFLLAFFARRTGSWREFGRLIVRIVPLAALIALTTLGLAWQSGFVRPDFKWPDFAWQFIVINLLFTCVAEETFFRALIQENLHRLCTARPSTEAVAVIVPAILFGAAHLSGGLLYAALASLAGLGYALIYCRTRRIEAALIAHLSVNIVHFTGFTYPGLAH